MPTTRTQSGQSYIRNVTLKTQSGFGDIRNITQQTQSGFARMTGGINLLFTGVNQYVNCSTVPVNPLHQTVMIVFQTSTLDQNQSVIGCIDADNPNSTTGYSINVNTNGSITFNAQKFNGANNLISVSTPPASIAVNTWYAATMRYDANTIYGSINNLPEISNAYPTNIDGSGIQNNSQGWFIGNQGFVPPYSLSSYWKSSIWKHTLWKFQTTITETAVNNDSYWNASLANQKFWNGEVGNVSVPIPLTFVGNYFLGAVAYVIIWNSALVAGDKLQAYQYVRNNVKGRGIILP
jgi:hypothetical protein